MVKQTPKYSLILALFIVSIAATYGQRMLPARVSFSANLDKCPMVVGEWQGCELELSPEIVSALSADTVMSRMYNRPRTDSSVGLLVTYRKYGRRDFVHRPELCYPAAGWEIISKRYVKVPYGGRSIPARLVMAEKQGEQEVIVYWFASGKRTEANYVKQQLLMAVDRLRSRKYGWAFIRINAPVIYDEQSTIDDIRSFLGSISVPLENVLSGDNEDLPHGQPLDSE